jgi:hypothetical protein
MGTKSKSLALVLVALFLTSLVTLPFAISTETKAWNTQTIDKNAAGTSFIAVDSNNNPHIVYKDYFAGSETDSIMYASLNGSSWNIQQVTSDSGMEYPLDFKLDLQNSPHILLIRTYEWTVGMLSYISWTGSNWTFQTIDSNASAVGGCLFLDSLGNPHVAYVANRNIGRFGTLRYATWTGTTWNIEDVDSNVSNAPISLGLDANGNPHIMYGHLQDINYASLDHGNWNIQTVIKNATVGNMVLDSNGYPHFIYLLKPTDQPNNALIYTQWDGSAWKTQNVTSIGTYSFGDLALDFHDHPQIDFMNNNGLMYANWTGTNWNFQTISNSNATGQGPLVIDSNGNPHISYKGIVTSMYGPAYAMYATTTLQVNNSGQETSSLPFIGVVSILAVVVCASAIFLIYRRHRKTAKPNQ